METSDYYNLDVVCFKKNEIVVQTRAGIPQNRIQRTPRPTSDILNDIKYSLLQHKKLKVKMMGWNNIQYAIPVLRVLQPYMSKPDLVFAKRINGPLDKDEAEVPELTFLIDNMPEVCNLVHSKWLDKPALPLDS